VTSDSRITWDEAGVAEIATLHDRLTASWHDAPPGNDAAAQGFLRLVAEQHRRNFDLWHEEDKARAPAAADAEIAAVKRRIDRLNQERNDLMEQLDEALAAELPAPSAAREGTSWNTETPGMAIDRMSVLALKIYHMREQEQRAAAGIEHQAGSKMRRETLESQRRDLICALGDLLADLRTGRKSLRRYRQMKMYNDPSLNPAIYGGQTAPLQKVGNNPQEITSK
jgi:hypothetical protein